MVHEIQVLHEPLPHVSPDQIHASGKPKVLVMGGGGIAPGVVTATVTIVKKLLERWFHPIGLRGSWEGVDTEWEKFGFVDFPYIDPALFVSLLGEGWTCLGPGRGMLHRNGFAAMSRMKEKVGFIGTAVVGGDGTISWSQALQYSLWSDGNPVSRTVAGIKTIDGDAEGSLAIGFMTSARKYAQAVQAMMREIQWENGIGIVGVYGRDNGHLALRAATLAAEENTPIIVLVPEFPVTREHFLNRVRSLKQQYGYVCIVASEGFAFQGEKPVMDEKKRDGAGNPKLLGCVDMLEDIIREDSIIKSFGKYALRTSEPGILTRSCDPIPADIALAQHAGNAVVDVIEREWWGHAVAMQGTFWEGFRPVTIPLWQVKTGNPVTPDLYNPETLQATAYFRAYISEQNPRFFDGDFSTLDVQKEAHQRLMDLIAKSELVEHNGVYVPRWAIQDESGWRELPTKWCDPISRLLET